MHKSKIHGKENVVNNLIIKLTEISVALLRYLLEWVYFESRVTICYSREIISVTEEDPLEIIETLQTVCKL